MLIKDKKRYEELIAQEGACLTAAQDAIDLSSSVGAKEWFQAAEAARKAANAIKYPVAPDA